MKIIKIILFLIVTAVQVFAQQKPLIDASMLNSWPYIIPYENGIALSKDGHYAAYVVYQQKPALSSLTIQDLRGNWKKTINCVNPRILFFSTDSRKLCWQQGDSVFFQLANNGQSCLLGVSAEVSYPVESKGEWFVLPAAHVE